jgi:hypothetical protein
MEMRNSVTEHEAVDVLVLRADETAHRFGRHPRRGCGAAPSPSRTTCRSGAPPTAGQFAPVRLENWLIGAGTLSPTVSFVTNNDRLVGAGVGGAPFR